MQHSTFVQLQNTQYELKQAHRLDLKATKIITIQMLQFKNKHFI